MIRARTSIWVLLTTAAWAGEGSPIQQAPSGLAALVNPFQGSVQAQRAGKKLFASQCAACHGSNRQGIGKAPPLDGPGVYQAAPGALFWVLRNGFLKRGMPSFAHLPEARRWQIIAFLQGAKEVHNAP